MSTYTQRDLDTILSEKRQVARVRLRFTRPYAGGVPAGDDALKAFVVHHLGLAEGTPEYAEAIARMRSEEIPTTPLGGEVETAEAYALNVIRTGAAGPYVAAHQVKALFKQAASRAGYFKKKVGSKGDVSELGDALATGASFKNPAHPWEIYLVDGQGRAARVEIVKLCGSVGTPQGKKSIMHHTETAVEGSEIHFDFHWLKGKLTTEDFVTSMALASRIGLGSCQSFGYGRFDVVELEV